MQSPDQNVERNRQLLLTRSLVGLKKYGVTTERDDLTLNEWLQHLLEELLDASNYIQAAMTANTRCGGGLAGALQQCITSMLDSGYNKDSVIIRVAIEALADHQPIAAGISPAALDVLAERQRQITAEGWTPEHDDEHACDEIAALAALYAMPPACRDWDARSTGYGNTLADAITPEGWQPKLGDRRRELIKAGALIIAEIERLDRAALRDGGAL